MTSKLEVACPITHADSKVVFLNEALLLRLKWSFDDIIDNM